MFAAKFITGFKREKRARRRGLDLVSEQVKKILQAQDQKLILMVRS